MASAVGGRLVVVAPHFYPQTGGYAHAITNFARLLAGYVPVTVLCPVPLAATRELVDQNLQVIRLTCQGWQLATGVWDLRAFAWLSRRVKENGIRAILFETAETPLLGLRALGLDVPVMLRVHATGETELAFQAPLEFDRDQIMRSLQRAYHYFLMRRFVRRAPVVLSTNPYHLRFVKEVALASNVVAISRRRFFVVPNTTDPDVDATVWNMPTPFVDEILRAGGRFLLSLGRLDRQGVEQKGVVDLLDALALARRHDPTMQRVFLVVVGDGDQRGALRDRAKALGLDAVVILPGHLPQASVFALTRAAHAVVLLSRYEGLAMFALESLALGAPLVVSRTGGLSDLVIEGRNGFTAEPHDPVGAAEALRRVLEASRNSMSAASREVFASRFAARRTLETFMDVLSLIAPSPLSERVEIELEAPPGR